MSAPRLLPLPELESARAALVKLAGQFPSQGEGAKTDALGFAAFCWAHEDQPFDASLDFRLLPHTMVFQGRVTPSVQRWPGHVPSDHVQVGVILSGAVEIATRTRRTVYRQGDLYVFPRWEWTRTRILEETEFVHVASTHLTLLERAVDMSPEALGRPLSSPLSDQLRAVAVTTVSSTDTDTDTDTDVVVDRILIMLLQAILGERQGRPDAPSLINLRRDAEMAIENHHADPDFHPRRLAEELGVSLRQLQRAFTATGASVASRLRERRTATAVDLLSVESTRSLPVAEIAHLAGFPSEYALRTALRSATGASPRQMRNLTVRQQKTPPF